MTGTNTETLDKLYHGMPITAAELAKDGPEPTFHFGAGHVLRIHNVLKGGAVRMHVHPYDHWSHIIVGGGRLMTDDAIAHVRAGGLIFVKAGKRHAFYADMDTVWVCVHRESEAEANGTLAT
jgi:quercetin dioxygenase-like cupin family protein